MHSTLFSDLRYDENSAKYMKNQWTRFAVIAFFLAGAILLPGRIAHAQSTSPYSQWKYGPPANPNFFPIGVWLQSPGNAQEFENIGVNMFVGFYGNLDAASMTTYASLKMPVVPTQNSVGLTSPQRSWIWGWDQVDEPDNAQANGSGGYGPSNLRAHSFLPTPPSRPATRLVPYF